MKKLALLLLLLCSPAFGASVTLSTGPTCVFKGIAFDAAGSAVVQCVDVGVVVVVPPVIVTPPPMGGFGATCSLNRWDGARFSTGNVSPGWTANLCYQVPAGWPGTSVDYGYFLINVSAPPGALSVYVDGELIGPDPLYQRGSDTRVPLNPLLAPGVHQITVKANLTTAGSIDFNRQPR